MMMMVGRIRVGLEGPDAFAVFQEAFLDNKHRCQPISHDGGWWINADQQHNNTTTTVKESTLQQMSMLGSVLCCVVCCMNKCWTTTIKNKNSRAYGNVWFIVQRLQSLPALLLVWFVWFVCNNTCYIALHSTTMSQALRVLVPVANGSEEIETVTIVGMLLHDTHKLSLGVCLIVWEISGLMVADTLRRAGIEVVLASVEELRLINGSRNIRIDADVLLPEVLDQLFDAIVIPGMVSHPLKSANQSVIDWLIDWLIDCVTAGGGPGSEKLRHSDELRRMLTRQIKRRKCVAAICASPVVVLGGVPVPDRMDYCQREVPDLDDDVGLCQDIAQSWIADKNATAYPALSGKLPRQDCVCCWQLPYHQCDPCQLTTIWLPCDHWQVSQRVVVDDNLITSRGPGTTLEFAHKVIEVLAGRDKADSVCRAMLLHTLNPTEE
jgi:putative intracellular protease/amidase